MSNQNKLGKVDWDKIFAGVSENAKQRMLPLYNESARGAVLLGVAKIDEALAALHTAHIEIIVKDSKDIIKNLLQAYGPLSSLAGKTQIAFAYGLIGIEDYKDLNRIRKIRNLAAHSDGEFTFDSEELRNELSRLTILSRVAKAEPDYIPGLEKYTVPEFSEGAKAYFILCSGLLQVQIIEGQMKIYERVTRIRKILTKSEEIP
jgi:DNA-binding MltR family transcriptional regulator